MNMAVREKTRKAEKSVITLIFAIAAMFCAVMFFGCADDRQAKLTVEHISIEAGESRDVLPYVYFPPSADRVVSLSCSDRCVSINDTLITGVAEGSAVVVLDISGVKYELAVDVVSPVVSELNIIGVNAVQTARTVSDISPVSFAAYSEIDIPTDVEWSVNGEQRAVGKEFAFIPSGYGEFIVRAVLDGLYVQSIVRVYRPTEMVAQYNGDLIQNGNFTSVAFVATESFDPLNPRSVFEWKVNGEVRGRSARFDFIPDTSGEYYISLNVNGLDIAINGSDFITVRATDRAPSGKIEFDDRDGVYVTWSDGGQIVRATVVSPDGTRKNINRSDAQYSYLFRNGRLDVSDFVDVFASVPAEYKITLVADGACEVSFMQYPIAAQAYAEQKIFARNCFISSEQDCAHWIEELFITSANEGNAYIGRNAGDIRRAISNKAAELGLDITATINGDTVSVTFGEYSSVPTAYSTSTAMRMYSAMPHIDYGKHSRSEDYVFALDRSVESIAVSTSEQLLYAAKYGLRPICEADGSAKHIYDSAKSRLGYIISRSYDDEQKVHAIYDYLQWITFEANVRNGDASRFLESVFGSRELVSDSMQSAVVTSEGAAKAFLLMCGIEGIDCIIQRMERNGEAYYFNKVMLDGLWYNIDVLDGKVHSSELGITRLSALDAHRGLLADDDTARSLGLIPYGGEYAAFDGSRMFYTAKLFGENGEYFDYYISAGEKDDCAVLRASLFYAFDNAPTGTVTIPVTGGEQLYSVSTVGAEFMLDGELTEGDISKLCELIESAADEYAQDRYGTALSDNGVIIYLAGNNLHVVVSPPRGSDK